MTRSLCWQACALAIWPGFTLAAPDLPSTEQLTTVAGWRAELLRSGWQADKSFAVDARGERGAFARLGCLVGDEPRTEILVTEGAASPHGVVAYRGATVKCLPSGVGVIDYADGSRWLGRTGSVAGIAVPEGLGELTQPDGVRHVMEAARQGLDWRMVRGYIVYHPDQDWYAQGEFGPGWRAGEGVYRWRDGREFRGPLEDAAPAGRGRYSVPGGGLIAGEVASGESGPAWRGTLEVTLPTASGLGPAGTYLVEPAPGTALGASLVPLRWAPTPALLAAGVDNARACPIPPEMPTGWVAWWPACGVDASGDIIVPVYSPDLTFVLTYVVRGGQLARSVLDQFGDTRTTLAPVARWEALMFRSTREGFVALGDMRRFDAAGGLVYQGPFVGLEPEGAGYCGVPAAEGGGVEPCTYAAGQRSDARHRERAARRAGESAQRAFEAGLVEQGRARAEAAAATERASIATQSAARQRGWFGRLGSTLIGAVTGRKADAAAHDGAVLGTAVTTTSAPDLPSALPPPVETSSLMDALAGGGDAPTGLLALQTQRLEHTCVSGYHFVIEVPYRTPRCLAAKLDYARSVVCGDSVRLAAVQTACQSACGTPTCAE